jgi:hypothetical protein
MKTENKEIVSARYRRKFYVMEQKKGVLRVISPWVLGSNPALGTTDGP